MAVRMERWNLLLGAHNHVMADRGWTVAVRIDTCRVLRKAMISLGPLKPLPILSLEEEPLVKEQQAG